MNSFLFPVRYRMELLGLAVLCGGGTSGLAQAAVHVGSSVGYPGTTASVPVTQERATNVVALQFDVQFNTNKVATLGALRAGLEPNYFLRSREISPGVERVVVYSLDNQPLPEASVFLARIPFAIARTEHVSSGPITPANNVLARLDGTRVPSVMGPSGLIFMRPVNLRTNGVADFFFKSDPNTHYTIQASTNLIDWIGLTNLTAPADFMDLVDPDAPLYPYRFYRWAK